MTDLDEALRSMLRERAHDIAAVPAHVTDLTGPDAARDELHERRAPHRTGWLIAASVAAVLAVGGATVALHDTGGDGKRTAPVRTAHPGPTVSPTPGLTRSTCTASEPGAWRSAFSRTSTYGAQGATALTFAGSSLVVTRDLGTSRDVAVVSPGGAVRKVYTVPDPDQNQVVTAAVDGDHLVVPVSRLPRDSNGVDPTVVRVDVVDLRTDAVTTVTTAPVSLNGRVRTIAGATVYRGTVYYDDRPQYVSTVAKIHAFDLATHVDRVVGTTARPAPLDGPAVQARGLFWSRNDAAPAIAATLPGTVDDGLTTARARRSLVTDGASYAWSPQADRIAFWTPGLAAAQVYRTGGTSDFPSAVAGRIVLFDDVQGSGGSRALDTRTAAVTPGPSLGGAVVLAHDGVLADSTDTSVSAAIRVDTSSLPPLHC